NQLKFDVSRMLELLTTNEVPATTVPTDSEPMLAPPPLSVRKIRELAVTLVVLIVAVPPTKVPVPIVSWEPSLTYRPLPTVEIFRSSVREAPANVASPAELTLARATPALFCHSVRFP